MRRFRYSTRNLLNSITRKRQRSLKATQNLSSELQEIHRSDSGRSVISMNRSAHCSVRKSYEARNDTIGCYIIAAARGLRCIERIKTFDTSRMGQRPVGKMAINLVRSNRFLIFNRDFFLPKRCDLFLYRLKHFSTSKGN
jgi:hypothetical protein